MNVHLYVELQEICSIGWADAQESLYDGIMIGKGTYTARSNSEMKSLWNHATELTYHTPCKNSGPPTGKSPAGHSLSSMAPDTPLWFFLEHINKIWYSNQHNLTLKALRYGLSWVNHVPSVSPNKTVLRQSASPAHPMEGSDRLIVMSVCEEIQR